MPEGTHGQWLGLTLRPAPEGAVRRSWQAVTVAALLLLVSLWGVNMPREEWDGHRVERETLPSTVAPCIAKKNNPTGGSQR